VSDHRDYGDETDGKGGSPEMCSGYIDDWGPVVDDLEVECDALRSEVERLKGLLSEAEEAIRDAADETGGEPEFSDERCSYESIQVSRGWSQEWRERAAVQRAIAAGKGGKAS